MGYPLRGRGGAPTHTLAQEIDRRHRIRLARLRAAGRDVDTAQGAPLHTACPPTKVAPTPEGGGSTWLGPVSQLVVITIFFLPFFLAFSGCLAK